MNTPAKTHSAHSGDGTLPAARGIRVVHDPVPMINEPTRLAAAAVARNLWAEQDPSLSMMNDRFDRGVFAPHPHRGFETLTYVLDGSLQHRDSRGGSGVLEVGDLQWMTAGSGLLHDEQPAGDGPVHVLQMWLNLPAASKLTSPRYQDLRGSQMPIRRKRGVEARVFSGDSGDVHGPALNHVPMTLVDFRIEPGHTVEQTVAAGDNGFVYVVSGEARLGPQHTIAYAGQSAWLDRDADVDNRSETVLRVEAGPDAPLHVLFFAGTPLHEPVVVHGPFVMNSEQQILQSIVDYNDGKFGHMR